MAAPNRTALLAVVALASLAVVGGAIAYLSLPGEPFAFDDAPAPSSSSSARSSRSSSSSSSREPLTGTGAEDSATSEAPTATGSSRSLSLSATGSAVSATGALKNADAVQAIETFYIEWLRYPGSPALEGYHEGNPYLTARLRMALDERAEAEPGFDPVLCAESRPRTFRFILTGGNETMKTALLTETFENSTQTLTVTAVQEQDGWAIDEIECPPAGVAQE